MIKRFFDVVTSLVALVLATLPALVVAALVWHRLGRPILFTQTRTGLNGKPFTFLKFRSMTDARDEDGNPLSDKQRLTAFGKWLRSTSLDELPQLLNVLRGEMSLVGPRPLLPDYLDYYSSEQLRRHHVRPGITGWAQINGRNSLDWTERLALDVWYVDNQSFWLDMKILLSTVSKIWKREGISADGHATMERFDQYARRKGPNV